MTSGTANRAAFGSNAVWAEKTKLGRSTPDSDAFASSEDEHELSHSTSNTIRPNAPTGHPRRSSFLSEIKSGDLRKGSITGSSLHSNASQPTTPSAEHGPWGSFGTGLTRVASNGSSGAAWAPSIWGSDRRELPLRLNEVSSPGINPSVGSPVGAEPTEYFPYNIPLQPVLKTHRSQSYSVGQLETDTVSIPSAVGTPSRSRPGAVGSHYRPMRPSTLGETVYTEGRALSQLNEVEDDDGPDQGVLLASPRARHEQLSEAGSNSLLRQATHENARAKHGSASLGASAAEDARRLVRSPLSHDMTAHSGAESAIEDDENEQVYTGRTPQSSVLWSTSLGFGMDDIPQSRRHSLADIPTRRGSLAGISAPGSAYDSVASAFANVPHVGEGRAPSSQTDFRQTSLDMELNMSEVDIHNRAYAHTYFSGAATADRSRVETSGLNMANNLSAHYPQPGPAGGVFGRPGWNVPLYIVTFKCSRAGIFYVHEGTGLQVKEGDLVIVEADRGQDLGTVTHAKMDWSRAREAMEKAGEDHYKWLMMFSRHNLTLADSENRGLMASSGSNQGNTNRERPAEAPGLGMQDPSALPQETAKPKMIKRLAQPHEIATLREKEGNEAKAKRICQQKANEHNLKMEILDAEFQVDWKKLTFYFYSTEYINFNLLVGDLFKIYKTRIWLSAINPAAFRSKPNQPPSAIGPGAVQGRNSSMNPTASAFHTSHNDHGIAYRDDITGAIPPPSYHDSGFSSPQHLGPVGGSFSRQPVYASPVHPVSAEPGAWYLPPGGYGQHFDSPFGGSPSPAHDSAYHPDSPFGPSSSRGARNGSRHNRPGNFGSLRQPYRD